MRLYSTNDKSNSVDLRTAVLDAFPIDQGLYMPEHIPVLPSSFFDNIEQYTFPEIGFIVAQALIGDEVSEADLYGIIHRAISFPALLVEIEPSIYTLELFHGPTLAFKDFGARFMAELMSHFLQSKSRKTTILVATSGDTGGAVAAGFHQVPGIEVFVLYPSRKVSPLQEKQLTTWGDNIHAVEVLGTFDDCQRMVKAAMIDPDLNESFNFSSANSINIARLIPQSFYYFEAYKQLKDKSKDLIVSVPSGNFGNLTAGLLAKKMDLPIKKFIAATNANNIVPEYLNSGQFSPRPSIQTLSNAMDVGNPSNFPRMLALYGNNSSTWNTLSQDIGGAYYTDHETLETIQEVLAEKEYLLDPHGAIGYRSVVSTKKPGSEEQFIFLETAHPGKFNEVIEQAVGKQSIPERLLAFQNKEKQAYNIPAELSSLKEILKR